MRKTRKLLRPALVLCAALLALSCSAFAAETGTTTDAGLRLRADASTSSAIYRLLPKGTKLTILDTLDGWYRVSCADGVKGFVSADYVKVTAAPTEAPAQTPAEAPVELPAEPPAPTEAPVEASERRGVVSGGTINVRTGPSTNYQRITTVRSGKILTILGEEKGWYKVSFGNTTGYMHGDYVKELSSESSSIGAQAAELALTYLGTPYVWGGASPNGFDCSGLTLYVYKQFGHSLTHSATAQYNNAGVYVAKEELQPGDLVFFSGGGYAIGHCGIYIGNGEFVHARQSIGEVVTNKLSMLYYVNHYVGAKRIV